MASLYLFPFILLLFLGEVSTFTVRPSYHSSEKPLATLNFWRCTKLNALVYNGKEKTQEKEEDGICNRRDVIMETGKLLFAAAGLGGQVFAPQMALAYTPDSDKLRESLYLISRAQEATVQQERFARRGKGDAIKKKMKMSLRLVEKSYRLLDQINYASQFVYPPEEIITATMAGNEAVDALQSALDFAKKDLGDDGTPLTDAQREFLIDAMQTTREQLFVFLKYMPQDKLEQARLRIEQENVDNRDEFDGDSDAGVYDPVKLPWK